MANSIGLVDGNVITASVPVAATAGQVLSSNGTTLAWTTPTTGTVTGLTGEVTTTGSGLLTVTLSNLAVISKTLSGLSVTSGAITSADSILTAMGKIQGQINGLAGGSTYKGTWNAATNTPTIVSSVGTGGDYYIVSTAGTTNINGTASWDVGDWIIFDGIIWQKVDNTDSVTSVNGFTGAVNLTTTNITEGTNLYYTDTRARSAISLTTTGSSGASTYVSGVLNVPAYTLSGLGGVPTTTTVSINGTSFDLSANRSWSVGTVTSVNATVPTGFAVGSAVTSSGNIAITFTPGYSLPTNALQANWDTAYNLTLGAALTKTDDTNVTITLGGTPATSLLRATSLTLGWTGQLAVGRGGSGASTLTGILVGNATSAFTGVTGTANQLLRRNAGNTAYEFFTHSFPTGSGTVNNVSKWTSATGLGNSQIIDDGTNVGVGVSPTSKLTVNGSVELRSGGGVIQTNNESNVYLGTYTTGGTPIGGQILAFGNNISDLTQRGGIEAVYSTENSGECGFNVFGYSGTLYTRYLKVSRNGNLILQNGGVYNDTTERLQVTGTAKITGATSVGGALSVTGAISAGSGPSDFAGVIRATNTGVPTTGAGVEIGYVTTSSIGFITSASRGGAAAYNTLNINGSTLNLNTASNGTINFGTGNIISTSGKLRLGSTPGTTGYINIGINATSGSQFNLATSSFTPLSPVNGDGWFDGTSVKFRILGSTTNFITGDLTSGYIPKATGVSAIANSLVYDNGTSVLVNTNTAIPVPGGGTYSHAFQILANAAGGMIVSTDDDSSAIGIVNSASSNKTWDISPFGADLVINESGIAPRLKFKAGGNIEAPVLAGTGTRMVVADSTGVLSTQAIPAGSITGSGVADRVAFWDGASSLTNSADLIWASSTSSLGVGIAPTSRLHVSGSGSNGTTSSLTVENSSASVGLRVLDSGDVYAGDGAWFRVQGASKRYIYKTDATDGIFSISSCSSLGTTFNMYGATHATKPKTIQIGATYAPISGSITYNTLEFRPTITQTGTANAITRGLYIDPLLSNALSGNNWRSIEWSNNSGWGIYGVGTAPSYFAGNVQIGSATAISNNINLQVTGRQYTLHNVTYNGTGVQTLATVKNVTINQTITGGNGINNQVNTGLNIFSSTQTIPETTTYANIFNYNEYRFDAAGVTLSAGQSTGGVRTISQLTTQNIFGGSFNGTMSHVSGIQINGYYNNATGSITPTITNAYQLLINDTGEFGHTFNFTNRWGIYQRGVNDKNYFAASVGIGVDSPVASAKLQVDSTTQGFLPPRMTTAQMNAIGTPAAGLIIFNTTDNKHYGYNGTAWTAFY